MNGFLRERSAVVRYVWFKLTPAGWHLVGVGVIAGTVGSASIRHPVYMVFMMLFCLGALAALVNLCHRPRLRVRAQAPERAVAGQPVRFDVRVTNTGRMPAYDLSAGFLLLPSGLDESAAPTLRRLAPGASAALSVEVTPVRRGVYALPPLRVFSTFPFHFTRSGNTRADVGALLVQPAFHPVHDVRVPVAARYQPGGVSLTSNVGESPEYIGNREFRPGDSMRHIDFRAWARLTQPAVREYQEEYYCRLALVLDTFVPRKRRLPKAGFEDLEAAVSLAASAADALSRGEYLIDIFAAGPDLYVFRAGRHTAHLDNILEILACVDACRSNPFERVTPALTEQLHNISAVICVFLDWDEDRAHLVRAAEEAGCEVKVFVVGRRAPDAAMAAALPADGQCFTPAAVRAGGIDTL